MIEPVLAFTPGALENGLLFPIQDRPAFSVFRQAVLGHPYAHDQLRIVPDARSQQPVPEARSFTSARCTIYMTTDSRSRTEELPQMREFTKFAGSGERASTGRFLRHARDRISPLQTQKGKKQHLLRYDFPVRGEETRSTRNDNRAYSCSSRLANRLKIWVGRQVPFGVSSTGGAS